MPKLVQPSEDDPMAIAQAAMPKKKAARGFSGDASSLKQKTWKVSPQIFPTEISAEAEKTLKDAVNFAVKQHGEQSLPELQVEEILAIAAEKAPTEDEVVQKLREAYNLIRKEYEVFTSQEHNDVVSLGGLHVIGTERHESRRVDNQLRGRAGRHCGRVRPG